MMSNSKKEYIENTFSDMEKKLYKLGVFKMKKRDLKGNNRKPLYSYKVRRLHPLGAVIVLWYAIVSGINDDTIKEIKEVSTWI